MSQLNVDTIKDRGGVDQPDIVGAAKAWVDYDQVNVSVNGSFNVSSVTDNAAGEYTVNFTDNMPNTNYVPVFVQPNADAVSNIILNGIHVTGASGANAADNKSISSLGCRSQSDSGTAIDIRNAGVAIYSN